jgi:hypothetical protein
MGGEDAAVQAVLQLAEAATAGAAPLPATLTLLHRRRTVRLHAPTRCAAAERLRSECLGDRTDSLSSAAAAHSG